MTTESIIKGLTAQAKNETELLVRIHDWVRDNIEFGFTADFESTTPNKTVQQKMGHCNAQADLFRHLLVLAGFNARLSFVFINKSILKKAIPREVYFFLPSKLFHAVTQVEVSGEWVSTDSYIFTREQFRKQQNKLTESGASEGFGIHQNSVFEWNGRMNAFSQADDSLPLYAHVFIDLKKANTSKDNNNKIFGIHFNYFLKPISLVGNKYFKKYINQYLN